MALSGSIGYRRKVYADANEIVKVLVGRGYATSSNSQPLAGNTMADNMNLGIAYVVPIGRKFTVYSYYMSYYADGLSSQSLTNLRTRPTVPIGSGTSAVTTNYGIKAHIDFSIRERQLQSPEGGNSWVFAEESGDCELVYLGGQYPKIGTITRTAQGIAPGSPGLYPPDVMFWGIEGPA